MYKLISRKKNDRARSDASGSGYRKVAGSCEYNNEHLNCIKCREFLD
jgi:hypothetical protein